MHRGCCVALPLSCFSALAAWSCFYPILCTAVDVRLLRGLASILGTASCLQRMLCVLFVILCCGCCVALRLLCGFALIPFAALAVWFCFYLMYGGCCVALPLSCLQPLLCGPSSSLCTVVAVWLCSYPVYSTCYVVLLLSSLQRLLCGIALILFTALAVWFCFYLMYSGCCVALP